jgi:hypothetical protein
MMKNFFGKLAGVAVLSLMIYSCAPEKDDAAAPTTTDPKQKWIASWSCTETPKQGSPSTFTVHIVDSSAADYVKIENFYNIGFQNKAYATVSGSSITIPSQNLSSSFNVHGSGTMVSNTSITMNYYVSDGSSIDTISAVFTKQ